MEIKNSLCLMGTRDEKGQMVVELAVLIPVVLVVMILVVDLMVFLGDCARFDRVAGEVVRYHAASPDAGDYNAANNTRAITASLREAMGEREYLDYSVKRSGAIISGNTSAPTGTVASFIPQPQRLTCTLKYLPWPLSVGIFGFKPSPITHEKSFVIDPYRPGVLL